MLVMLSLFRECEVAAETLEAIGETGGIQFLKSKLGEVVTRIYGQIETIKERERADRKRCDSAADDQCKSTNRQLDTHTLETAEPAE